MNDDTPKPPRNPWADVSILLIFCTTVVLVVKILHG